MADPNTRDLKLIQYLTEAHGKEKELETALQAHIGMTTRAPYKKRLQQHLKETKAHARATERRIKQLGGKVETVPAPVAEAASAVQAVTSKAVSAAKGPLHALRGTGEHEKMLKNAKTEFSEEHEEIAMYSGIEALAEAVGDRETAKLARDIRREEERMANFLEKQIGTLAKRRCERGDHGGGAPQRRLPAPAAHVAAVRDHGQPLALHGEALALGLARPR